MGSGFRRVMAACAAWASLAAGAVANDWTLVDLGTLGGFGGIATAVSDNGVVVGCASDGASRSRAFIHANGQMRELWPGVGTTSCALAVNNAGMVAGRIDGEIVVWNGGQLIRTGLQGNAAAINEAGVVVGDAQFGGASHAFMWSDGAIVDLGTLKGGTSKATGVNERNQVAGLSDGNAFIYEGGAMRDLGFSPTIVAGINERGEVVGMMSFGHGAEPFIYDGAAHQIAGAYGYAGARGLNNAGQVICSGEGVYGFLVEGGAAYRLDNLPGVAAAGGHHLEPMAINERGWMVGQNGSPDFHPFLLMPRTAAATAAGASNPLARAATRTLPLIGRARG
jgi:probable HAF family extracellular repeat protein